MPAARFMRFKRELLIGIILILVFLIGFLPQYARQQELNYQNKRITSELQIARLRGELAMTAYQAQRRDFAEASSRSTIFFSSLQKQIAQIESKRRKERLVKIASQEHEITDLLNKNDKAAAEKLAQLYLDLYEVTEPLPERLALATD